MAIWMKSDSHLIYLPHQIKLPNMIYSVIISKFFQTSFHNSSYYNRQLWPVLWDLIWNHRVREAYFNRLSLKGKNLAHDQVGMAFAASILYEFLILTYRHFSQILIQVLKRSLMKFAFASTRAQCVKNEMLTNLINNLALRVLQCFMLLR